MTTKSTAELLVEYNIIREHEGLKPLKSWKQGHLKLVEAVALKGVRVTKGAPAVAEGAYRTEREARHRTGVKITTSNVVQLKPPIPPEVADHQEKQQTAGDKKKGKTPEPTAQSGELHLSIIAESIGMTPRTARIKARAHKEAIRKLEVKGKKYVFPATVKAKVIDILRMRISSGD